MILGISGVRWEYPVSEHDFEEMLNFFYEFANVKPWPVFFSSRLISFAISGPSPTRALRWVPGLAVLGEAGNPAILVSAQPRCQSLTIFPPGLAGLSCAFRLAASA